MPRIRFLRIKKFLIPRILNISVKLMHRPVRSIANILAKLAWKWREEHLAVIEGFNKNLKLVSKNEVKIIREIIRASRFIVEFFFNSEWSGCYFDQHINGMSIAQFRKIYSLLFAYFVALINETKIFNIDELIKSIQTIGLDNNSFNNALERYIPMALDIAELGRKTFDDMAEIVEYDGEQGLPGVFRGMLVVFGKAEWEKIEQKI